MNRRSQQMEFENGGETAAAVTVRLLPSPSPRPSPSGRGRRLRTIFDGFGAAVSDCSRKTACAGMLFVDDHRALTPARTGLSLFRIARTFPPLLRGEGRGEGKWRVGSLKTAMNSRALTRSHGGAAVPPCQNMVGRTCRSAVTFRKRAKRRLRPAAHVQTC
jgi:hypothetical protein